MQNSKDTGGINKTSVETNMNNPINAMSDDKLEQTLKAANDAYRNTDAPAMPDSVYDLHIAELARRNPAHPFLVSVEPEADFGRGKVRHRRPMLSTEKSYTDAELTRWVRRVEAAAVDLGMELPVPIKINAKLDGMAGRLEDGVLASRGDGLTGNDISHTIEKGLVVVGDGDGELVMDKAYFDAVLSDEFKHPRNVVSGAVGAVEMRPAAQKAFEDQAVRFVSYSTLSHVMTDTSAVINDLSSIRSEIIGGCDYPTDGLILVVEDPAIREEMGSNSHHHRWMLAAKTITEVADSLVTGIQWQTGRTGRLTPVVQISPVEVSGAIISNVNAHHAGNLAAKGIGPGSVLTVTRAGEVIPYILDVKKVCLDVKLPSDCPSCETELSRQGDFLICSNNVCPGRLRARFSHFFNILQTIDLFGPVACERLVDAGVTSIREVFSMSQSDFEAVGFGPGQAANLCSELSEARNRPVDDFRVLAALGVEHLGRGDSKRLLKHYSLSEVASVVTESDINDISGFGDLTSKAIVEGLPAVRADLEFLESYLRAIVVTPARSEAVSDSPISGKHIVFTGTMTQGSRADMVKSAEALGAISQSAVNKKTDYLVAGEKVGKSKLTKAESLGTVILSESDYLALVG